MCDIKINHIPIRLQFDWNVFIFISLPVLFFVPFLCTTSILSVCFIALQDGILLGHFIALMLIFIYGIMLYVLVYGYAINNFLAIWRLRYIRINKGQIISIENGKIYRHKFSNIVAFYLPRSEHNRLLSKRYKQVLLQKQSPFLPREIILLFTDGKVVHIPMCIRSRTAILNYIFQ
jgi:hypothetical protein